MKINFHFAVGAVDAVIAFSEKYTSEDEVQIRK
jgi:hypothetical protein